MSTPRLLLLIAFAVVLYVMTYYIGRMAGAIEILKVCIG